MTVIAIIGTGNMAGVHAAAFAALGVPVAAMCDIVPAGQDAARRFGARFYTDAEQMLREVRPDVVDICTPTDTHRALAELAAAHGCHVILEKPLARTAADAEAIVSACRRAGVHLLPGHVTRFYPEYRAVRERIRAGTVGAVHQARLFRQSDRPRAPWTADLAASGGVILDLMIHDIDWIQWAIAPVAEVYSRATPQVDQAHVLLRLTTGATALLEGSWLHPSGFAAGLTVTGDQGSLTMNCRGPASPLQIHLRGRPAAAENPLARSPHMRELAHFLDVLNGTAEPEITPAEGLSAIRVAEAALASARLGRPVEVSV